MNVAERLVEILEENNITHIFGIPGDQIMPMYKALSKSSIIMSLQSMNRLQLTQPMHLQELLTASAFAWQLLPEEP